MRRRRQNPSSVQTAAIVGGVAAVVALAIWRASRVAEPSMLQATYRGVPAPPAPPPAALPSGERPRAWLMFQKAGGAVPLMPGISYRAAIDLPWGAGVLATDARVRDKAHELGFGDVAVMRDRPLGWPELEDADLFVEATYKGPPKWLERHDRIVGAWAFV